MTTSNNDRVLGLGGKAGELADAVVFGGVAVGFYALAVASGNLFLAVPLGVLMVITEVMAINAGMGFLFGDGGVVCDLFRGMNRQYLRDARERPVGRRIFTTDPSYRLRMRGAVSRQRGRLIGK